MVETDPRQKNKIAKFEHICYYAGLKDGVRLVINGQPRIVKGGGEAEAPDENSSF